MNLGKKIPERMRIKLTVIGIQALFLIVLIIGGRIVGSHSSNRQNYGGDRENDGRVIIREQER